MINKDEYDNDDDNDSNDDDDVNDSDNGNDEDVLEDGALVVEAGEVLAPAIVETEKIIEIAVGIAIIINYNHHHHHASSCGNNHHHHDVGQDFNSSISQQFKMAMSRHSMDDQWKINVGCFLRTCRKTRWCRSSTESSQKVALCLLNEVEIIISLENFCINHDWFF